MNQISLYEKRPDHVRPTAERAVSGNVAVTTIDARKRSSGAVGPLSAGSAPEPVIVPSLLSIAKSTRAFVALLLVEIGLHPGQDQLIDKLEASRLISVSALADQLSVRPSTVSKMLDRLVDKGLLVRSANEADARRTMVGLTEKGVEIQAAIRAIWSRLEQDLTGQLSADDLDALDRALVRTDALLSQKLRRLR